MEAQAGATASVAQNEGIFNNVLWGTLAFAFVSSAAGILYYLAQQAVNQLTRNFILTLSLSNRDEDAFSWLLQWVSQQNSFFSASNVSLSVVREDSNRFPWEKDLGDTDPSLKLLPGEGLHMFRYEGRFMWLNRYREGNPVSTGGWSAKPFCMEHLQLTTYGRDREVFMRIFATAMNQFRDKHKGLTKIYNLNRWCDGWAVALVKQPRSFRSVILDKQLSEEILTDAREFLDAQKFYQDRGIPYRRGYLLYGPPGTGKTSFIQALAGEMGLNICFLSLSSKQLTDETLNSCLSNSPKSSIILLEDVDAIFVDRNTTEDAPRGVSFSGLLNAIDGVASQEGRLFFMTTNHIELLDEALIRPGRCDVKVKLSFASRKQVHDMFLNFFGDERDLAEKFADAIPQNTVSMAQLQGHFMRHKSRPLEALQSVKTLLQEAEGPEVVEDIRISAWLRRLALSQYTPGFNAWKLYYLSDIKTIDPDMLCTMLEIKHSGHVQRIKTMMQGKENTKRGFTLANRADIKQTWHRFFPHHDMLQVEFMSAVPANTVSVFEVENHLANYVDSPTAALERVQELLDGKQPMHVLVKETVVEFFTRMGVAPDAVIKESPAEWFAAHNLPKVAEKCVEDGVTNFDMVVEWDANALKEKGVEKAGEAWAVEKELKALKGQRLYRNLRERGITDMKQLTEMDDGKLEELGVSPHGVRWRIVKELERLKSKYEKEELQNEKLIEAGTPRFDLLKRGAFASSSRDLAA